MKGNYLKILFIAELLLQGCLDPFDPKITGKDAHLVVDGVLTNQAKQHSIQLSYSAGYNSEESVFGTAISGAKIYIVDNLQNQELLQEDVNKRGSYVTRADFQGIVGRNYYVRIALANGKTYQSKPELMKATPAIDRIYQEYEDIHGENLQSIGKFNVYLDTKDPAASQDYYRWFWTHYEIPKYARLYSTPTDPPVVYEVGYCTPACWNITQCNGCIILASDLYINGNPLKHQLVATVAYDSQKPYYLDVEQHSLTKEAYTYWKAVNSQVNNTGGIFDLPPAHIQGNFYNVNDVSEEVLGFFGASAISEQFYYVTRDKVGKSPFSPNTNPHGLYSKCDKCTETTTRTAQTPKGWNLPLQYIDE